MKVLWLTSWYPTKISPYNGDFIQRHAKAAALFNEIEVLHVVKDADGVITENIKEVVIVTGQLTERIIYYKPLKTSISVVDRVLSSLKYKKIYRNVVKRYMQVNGTPAFMHVHIAMKAGLIAVWAKRKFGIQYILTEQWGGYLDEAKPNIKDYNTIYHYYWNKIFKEAVATTFVSAVLQDYIKEKYRIKNSYVIPNVVDTDIFHPAPKQLENVNRFIHISTMSYQKNTEAILQALHLLKNKFSFEMYLYGTANALVKDLIDKLDLQNYVFIMGEAPQQELAKIIQQSDALVLYSRYETFGCVLIEANACGVPVIVSDIKVFHELVEEGTNGIFSEGDNAIALAEKLEYFISAKSRFDKNKIAVDAAQRYNFRKIGQQFNELYTKIST